MPRLDAVRRLSFGALRIAWGNPVTVEARDVRLANASWGSAPDQDRSAFRMGAAADSRSGRVGFRVARDL